MPRGKQKRNYLIKYRQILRNVEPGVVVGIAAIVIALFYGAWGVILNQQMLNISKKQVELSNKQIELSNIQIQLSKTQNETSIDLKHFIKLLGKTDTMVSLSDSELVLNRNEQRTANKNAEYTKLSNEGRFYLAYQNLESLIFFMPNNNSSRYLGGDSTERFTFLNNVDLVLKSQLDNPYLLSNKYMFQQWLDVRDSVYHCKFNESFFLQSERQGFHLFGGRSFEENQKDILQEWHNCFIAVAYLEQNIGNYMLYYRWKKTKQPSPESYRLLEESRKNGFKVRSK